MKTLFTSLLILFCIPIFAQNDTTVLLDGSGSLYADTYSWRQIDGQPITLSQPDSVKCFAQKLGQGRFEFELTVTNPFGTDKDSVIITVIKNALSIPDQVDEIWRRPDAITKLEIKVATRSSDLLIQIKSPRTQAIECILYDIAGRALAKVKMNVIKGTNYMKIAKPQIRGIYILRFVSYFDSVTKKIII